MDINALSGYLALSRALVAWESRSNNMGPGSPAMTPPNPCVTAATLHVHNSNIQPFPAPVPSLAELHVDSDLACVPAPDTTKFQIFVHNCAMSEVAAQEDAAVSGRYGSSDVWADQETLDYLLLGELPTGKAARRVKQRAQHYRMQGEDLVRVMSDGSTRVVPPPPIRASVVQRVHESTGHFGVKRTRHLIQLSWWWAGIEQDVVRELKHCQHCMQMNARFSNEHPTLQSLPIEGYMYQWSCDLFGPLPLKLTWVKTPMCSLLSIISASKLR
jgi:hypothetical protein